MGLLLLAQLLPLLPLHLEPKMHFHTTQQRSSTSLGKHIHRTLAVPSLRLYMQMVYHQHTQAAVDIIFMVKVLVEV